MKSKRLRPILYFGFVLAVIGSIGFFLEPDTTFWVELRTVGDKDCRGSACDPPTSTPTPTPTPVTEPPVEEDDDLGNFYCAIFGCPDEPDESMMAFGQTPVPISNKCKIKTTTGIADDNDPSRFIRADQSPLLNAQVNSIVDTVSRKTIGSGFHFLKIAM